MDDKKYKRQIVFVVLLIIFAVLTILIMVKLQTFNKSEEIIIDNNQNSKEYNSDNNYSDSVLKVDVRGAVHEPGVYEFIEGQIVEDAIKKAGGLSDEADTNYVDKNINRASKLINEQRIYIPAEDENMGLREEVISDNPGAVYSDKININTSTKDELMSLSGIGSTYAERIIEFRPYTKIEDIKQVKGIGDSIYEKIKDKIKV